MGQSIASSRPSAAPAAAATGRAWSSLASRRPGRGTAARVMATPATTKERARPKGHSKKVLKISGATRLTNTPPKAPPADINR